MLMALTSGDYFLHSTTSSDVLDHTSPTASTAQFEDASSLTRTTSKEIGTWYAAPADTAVTLTALQDLHVWLGLKNSDDQGAYFDLRAELWKNNTTVIAFGETKNIQGVTRNPSQAKEVTVAFGSIVNAQYVPGYILSLKILTKVADSGGHSSAVGVRLYYDALSWPSRFGSTFITQGNTAPVANAGPDQTVVVGTIVQLDGSKSGDLDGDGLTWHWTLLSRPAGSLATCRMPPWSTPPSPSIGLAPVSCSLSSMIARSIVSRIRSASRRKMLVRWPMPG
jgi:PKD domain-containing protein